MVKRVRFVGDVMPSEAYAWEEPPEALYVTEPPKKRRVVRRSKREPVAAHKPKTIDLGEDMSEIEL